MLLIEYITFAAQCHTARYETGRGLEGAKDLWNDKKCNKQQSIMIEKVAEPFSHDLHLA